MPKKNRSTLPFDRRGGAVVIQRRLIGSDAYIRLSAQAKALLHLMHTHWRPDKPVGYGEREAGKNIPCCRKTARRSFRELSDAGFIQLVDESLFCSRAQSRTRTWRLTWMPWKDKPPTNDWEEK